MNALEILNRCRDGIQEVERLEQRERRLVSSSASPAMIGHDLDACRAALARRRRSLDAERLAACRIVDMLPDPQCGILYRYFVGGQSQGGIVEALHVTVGYYKRKKRDGLIMAERIDPAAVEQLLPGWYLEGKHEH